MKTPHKKMKQNAFTLAEMLIALPIMAILMVSMGVAITGAMENYEETTQTYSLNQSIRIIADRMAKEIRSAENATCTTNLLTLDMPGNPDEIKYLLYNGTLYHYQTTDGQTTVSPLLGPDDGMTVTSFTIEITMRDIEGTYYATLVTAKLGLQVEGQTKSYTISGSPRKNQESL